MIVFAVYVIKYDGSPLVTRFFRSEEGLPDSVLTGNLINVLRGFTVTVLEGEMKTIEVEGVTLHIRSFGLFNIAIVTDINDEIESTIQELGFRFMKDYGELILDDLIRLDKIQPFKKTIKDIIRSKFDESGLIKPSKLLNTINVFQLPLELKPVALAVITLSEGTLHQIAKESDLSNELTKLNLKKLQKEGYLGKRKKDDKTYYFCSSN